tara:strand:+ start:699 stop:806 length:108 start_codon:yes stop_codon:yes gene_type:complete
MIDVEIIDLGEYLMIKNGKTLDDFGKTWKNDIQII